MLYREIIVVCSEIHIKHINTLCGRIVALLNVKFSGICIVTTGVWRLIYVTRKFSPYSAVNTLRLCYKNQSVNVV